MGRLKTKVVAIEFEIRDWEKGFWVTVQIPYSERNWEAVMSLRGSASIKLIREPI